MSGACRVTDRVFARRIIMLCSYPRGIGAVYCGGHHIPGRTATVHAVLLQAACGYHGRTEPLPACPSCRRKRSAHRFSRGQNARRPWIGITVRHLCSRPVSPRHRVDSAHGERPATQQALDAQPRAADRTPLVHRFDEVVAARRHEFARSDQQRAQGDLVEANAALDEERRPA